MSASDSMSSMIDEPLDLVKLCLDEEVYVKLKGNRELTGRLHAYDQHLNMVLEDVEEKVTIIEDDESTEGGEPQVLSNTFKLLFLRGDGVVLVSPPKRG